MNRYFCGVEFLRLARFATCCCAVLLLAACSGSGGESTDTASATGGSGSGNGQPSISGVPTLQVLVGNEYSFTPSVSDPDGDPLTLTIENLPAWADFDQATGEVSGTPDQADVGTYTNVTVVVSDGTDEVRLAAFSIEVIATAGGSATLTWMPPTLDSDGGALTDLAGFRIYWGQSVGNYTSSVTLNNPGLTTYVVDQLTPATWYFVATAFDFAGNESEFSEVATKTVQQ